MRENPKFLLFKLLSVFLIVLTLAVIYSVIWGPVKKFSDSLAPVKTFTVSAEGKTVASPDIAKVSFSVVTEGKNPETLADDNNKKMNKVIETVKSYGVKDDDIKTTQYNLYPTYQYNDKSHTSFVSGYRLTQAVLVKIRDLNKVAPILGNLPKLGVNDISSVSFEVENPEKYLAEARRKAFDKARQKAEEMTGENNVKLGDIINFSEYQGGTPVPYYETMGKGGLGGATVTPSIQPGTQEVTINVSITYTIR